MKKHRRLNKTDHSFFSNNTFQLKPTEPPKERSRRKSNLINHLKNQISSSDSRYLLKDKSTQKSSMLEKLHFRSTQQENFKLPKSLSKRSKLKPNGEDQRSKYIVNTNDLSVLDFKKTSMAEISNVGIQKKMTITDFMFFKRSKGISSREIQKEKIEKSALQKYQNMISNENSQNENNVNEQNAQALYLLLQSNRKNIQDRNNKTQQPFSDKYSKRYLKDQEQDGQSMTSLEFQAQQYQNNIEMAKKERSQMELAKQKQKPYLLQPKKRQNQFKDVIFDQKSEKQNFQESFSSEQNEQIQQQSQKNVVKAIPKQTKINESSKNIKAVIPHPNINVKINKNKDVKLPQQQQEKKIIKKQYKKEEPSEKSKKHISDSQQQKNHIKNKKQSKKQIQLQIIKPKKLQSKVIEKIQQIKQNSKEKKIQIKENEQEVKRIIQQNKKSFQNLKALPPSTYKSNAKSNQIPSKSEVEIEIDAIPQANTYHKQTPKSTSKKQIQKPRKDSMQNTNSQKNMTNRSKQMAKKPQLNKYINNIKSVPMNKGRNVMSDYHDDEELEEVSIGVNNPKHLQNKIVSQNQRKDQGKIGEKVPPKVQQKKVLIQKQQKAKQPKKMIPTTLTPLPKQQIPQRQPTQQNNEQFSSQQSPLDDFVYYMQRLEDIGQYRMKSKDLYSDKSIDKQLIQVHKVCAYYMAHQFLYLTKITHNIIKQRPITQQYYSVTIQQLNQMQSNGELDSELQTVEINLQESKKLLKKCYDQCKNFLNKDEQILILESKSNYHIKCCSFLIKQFKKVYDLYSKNKANSMLLKRCIYIIQIYGVLKAFNNEQIKEYEEYQDLEDPVKHLDQYKSFFI